MAGALVVAVLLHLVLLIPLALWTAVTRADAGGPEPIEVQLEPLPPEAPPAV